MFLRRITQHLEIQNWTAVWLELVIVVVGVFLGLQVSNWNEDRVSQIEELAFIETIRDDISQDIVDAQGFKNTLAIILGHGNSTLESIDADSPCDSSCWSTLLDYFMASQWIDVRTSRATPDEMKRSGLPRDPELKKSLTRYYGTAEQVTLIVSHLPRYRELVRSLIPAEVQAHMWSECVSIEGRQQILNSDCSSPINNAEASAIIELLRADGEIKSSLTYWMSTIGVVTISLRDQSKIGQTVIEEIDQHLAIR